jgi:SAM-dependent methyltransferase
MNPQEMREMVTAFQKSRIILTAFELDVFTFIDDDSMDAETVSKGLKLNNVATERLLNALVGLKLLEKNNGSFRNTKESLIFLSKTSPEYMAGFAHSNHLWNTWSHLTDVVKTGKAAHNKEINERGEEWLEAFIHAMHDRGKKQAPEQIARIDLTGVNSLLDIGGGSGCFSMEFLKRKTEMKSVVFDLPNVVPISKKIVEQEGFSGKIDHYTGDYTTDELPKGFDLIFLSAIVHSNSYETNRKLVRKCYDSLNSNGRIVIQDWVLDDAKTEPLQGTVFSINMLVGTEEGDCYSENEIKSWYENAGFTDVHKVDLDSGLAQMIGVKK